MANVKIRLIIDTENLEKQTKKQIEKNCSIVDNTKDNSKRPGKPDNHCTEVDHAQTIEWSGLPINPKIFDQVSIDAITYVSKNTKKVKKEKDLFGVPYLTGLNGVIYGTIIANNLDVDEEESYSIKFTVIKADGKSKSFNVDPKLRVKT